MTDQNQERQFEGHAIVELMGHNTIAGYVTEVTIAGAAMLRVDVPAVGDQPAYSKFVGGSAIYGITPTTQEIAQRAAQRLRVRPVSEWTLPDSTLRPALVDSMAGGENYPDDQDEGDDNEGDDNEGDDNEGDDNDARSLEMEYG